MKRSIVGVAGSYLLVLAGLVACSDATAPVTAAGVAKSPGLVAFSAPIDLGTLGGTYSTATAINQQGLIVGSSTTAAGVMHAFVWSSQHGMKDIGTLAAGDQSAAVGINDNGEVAGTELTSSGGTRGWVWTAKGGMQDIGELSAGLGATPIAINNAGEVVGHANNAAGVQRGFVWFAQSGMHDIGAIDPRGLNANWEIAGALGNNAEVRSGFGLEIALPGFSPNSFQSSGQAVNDSGAVVGSSVDNVPQAAFWPIGGGVQNIGNIGEFTSGFGINNSNLVVGWGVDINSETHGFLWSAAGGFSRLPTLGGDQSDALDVDNAGNIVGGAATSLGNVHAYLLSTGRGAASSSASTVAATTRVVPSPTITAVRAAQLVRQYGRNWRLGTIVR